ncbi:hypothetical protein MAMMFC1_02155 [Methylomusa anaerophila]|uniref:Uncharacterized protein n=1 Tax=Methylomusa anaerophila TaxID=1930071 RepID=A0A348AK73_9FIRM|nr:hypothetical protein MAMMFC1_02155 [Methylomusa anaerophila]
MIRIQVTKCFELLRKGQMLGTTRTGTEAYWGSAQTT